MGSLSQYRMHVSAHDRAYCSIRLESKLEKYPDPPPRLDKLGHILSAEVSPGQMIHDVEMQGPLASGSWLLAGWPSQPSSIEMLLKFRLGEQARGGITVAEHRATSGCRGPQ